MVTPSDLPDVQANAVRVEFFGDEVDALSTMHPMTGELVTTDDEKNVFRLRITWPGLSAWSAHQRHRGGVGDRLAEFEAQGKLLEAQRPRMRTTTTWR